MDLSRRDLLTFGGATLAAGTLAPTLTWGQAPRRGCTLTIRGWGRTSATTTAGGWWRPGSIA